MTEKILQTLRCPICGAAFTLTENQKSLVCTGTGKHHCFDRGASGYVNFAPPAMSRSGDNPELVRARTAFLDRGDYDPIRQSVCKELAMVGGTVADAGCGEGYYTVGFSDVADAVLGFDLSKSAADAAARRARRAGKTSEEKTFFGVGSIYELPVKDASLDAVTSLFAPCAEEEFARVLKDGGILVTVAAGENHLVGLKKALYSNVYVNTDRVDMPRFMTLDHETNLEYDVTLSCHDDIMNLFSMTPYYYRTSPKDLEKLEGLETLSTKVQATVRVYRKNK